MSSEVARPAGPSAEVSVELTGGNGVFVASSSPAAPALDAAGYVEHEYEATGTATGYTAAAPLPGDGRWSFQPSGAAPYRTRVLVRRPAEGAKRSGTVVVEWLNVSSGFDADPDWQMLHEEITRRGDVWVGVSAQVIGVNGGPVAVSTPQSAAAGAGLGLRGRDPARYGTLDHPGDAYAYDIFTQVARAAREGGAFVGGGDAPDTVVAVGESQSAFALVSYVNGVQPLTLAFDGFLVHSRGAGGLPVAAPGQAAGIIDAITGPPTILRTDTTVPIIELQSETDVTGVLRSVLARQDDSDRFRLWEVAGTAHADMRLVGANAEGLGCGAINDGPMHVVAKAALSSLLAWVRSGTVPPTAARLEVTAGDSPATVRAEDGIAVGGIRTPPVDVPVDVLSGEPGPGSAVVCILSGSTTPLPAADLAARYPSRADYLQRYTAAADAAIAAGFVLPDDRDALLAYADPARLPG